MDQTLYLVMPLLLLLPPVVGVVDLELGLAPEQVQLRTVLLVVLVAEGL
jgi:hypothetical protein